MKHARTRRELFKQLGLAGLAAATLRQSLARAEAGASGIRRLLFYYLPGGIHRAAWRPATGQMTDVAIDAPRYGQMDAASGRWRHALDPFNEPKYAALKPDMMLFEGVDMRSTMRPDIHVNGIWAALRGRPCSFVDPVEFGKFSRFSIDRLIGEGWDRQGRGDSMLVSQCTNVLVSELGQQANVSSHSEGHTARVIRSSGEAWDLFLKDVVGTAGGASPDNAAELARLQAEVARWDLSATSARAKAMVPAADADKVDELIAIFRTKQGELRRRITSLGQPPTTTARIGALPLREAADPDPSRFMRAKSELLAKVMAPAMALGRTNVVVWQTCGSNNTQGLWYDGGQTPHFHDSIAHGGAYKGAISRATWDVYSEEMRMLGDLLLELKAIPEGDGSVLDNTVVVTYSDMCDGSHHFRDLPCFTLLAGGRNGSLGGKRLKLGKYVKLPALRGHNDLLVTIAHLMGVTDAPDRGGKPTTLDSMGPMAHNKGLITELFDWSTPPPVR